MYINSESSEKELLSKYYKLNGDTVEVTLIYNTFSELIDPNFGDDKVEKLSNKLFASIELAFKEIPVDYDILLNIKIKDFGNYNQEEAIRIIKENIQMRLHTVNRTDKKKKYASTFVMLIGLFFIIGSYFVPKKNVSSILYELVDLCGQIFVWEGMYAYFLDRTENKLLTKQYRKKLVNIKISKFGEENVNGTISLKKDAKNIKNHTQSINNNQNPENLVEDNSITDIKKIANIK